MNKCQTTINTYNKSAEAYLNNFMEMDLYHDTFDIFCELSACENPQVFEIGCGPGNVSKHILANRPEIVLKGIDLAPNMIKLAKENNPTATFQIMDCRKIDQIKEKYNAVMCAFVMPYLSKEECIKLIKDAYDLLLPNGVFYLSTMEDDYNKSGYETTSFSGDDEVYIYYHQYEVLHQALKDVGFAIEHFERKKYPEPDGTFLTDMIFIVSK